MIASPAAHDETELIVLDERAPQRFLRGVRSAQSFSTCFVYDRQEARVVAVGSIATERKIGRLELSRRDCKR